MFAKSRGRISEQPSQIKPEGMPPLVPLLPLSNLSVKECKQKQSRWGVEMTAKPKKNAELNADMAEYANSIVKQKSSQRHSVDPSKPRRHPLASDIRAEAESEGLNLKFLVLA